MWDLKILKIFAQVATKWPHKRNIWATLIRLTPYEIMVFLLYRRMRREWDSNPRYAINVNTLSKRAPSATRPPLQNSIINLIQRTEKVIIFICLYIRLFFFLGSVLHSFKDKFFLCFNIFIVIFFRI